MRVNTSPEPFKRLSRGAVAVICAGLIACGRTAPQGSKKVFGNPHQGGIEIYRAACGSCHVIPGIVGAEGIVGPPLDRFGAHKFIAGLLSNTPDNLALWIAHPQKIAPGNAMPDMGLNGKQARDIAAYLEKLR